ncbi:MAG: hypothetical protein IPQ08_09235 [Chitinophagaceae bacterium]|nr:hypothetical protein [Chitinophagaceae bacterium]
MKPSSTKFLQRIVILPKDLELLFGYSPRGARNLIAKLKKQLGRPKHSFILLKELSEHLKLQEEQIRSLLRVSFLNTFFLLGQLILFRSDLDLWLTWYVCLFSLSLEVPVIRYWRNRLRLFLLGGPGE